MPSLKLRTKLALFYAALFAILLASAGITVYRIMALRLTAAADDNLVDHGAGLWGYIQFHAGKPVLTYDTSNHQIAYFVRDATRYYQLYDAASGELLLESTDSSLMHLALPVSEVGRRVGRPGIDVIAVEGVALRLRSALYQANGHFYLLRVGVSVEEDLVDLAELKRVLFLLLPVMTLVGVVGAWWMAGKVLRPLQELQNEASAISITQLHRRLPHRGTRDELDALAATFNQVFTLLEDAVRRMKQFSAYMSHELRTPLTVLRGEAEIALMRPGPPKDWRGLLTSQLEEFDKLDRVIGRFLLLARAEAGQIEFEMVEFDLCALAAGLGKEMIPVAMSRGISLKVACGGEARLVADRGWIERVILNLLDNAIKFTAGGGQVHIVARSAGDRAMVEVSDTGSGIAEAELPHIFDCFYRAHDSRPTRPGGAGLGLALTKWIVEKHGGVIQVDSRVGAGSVFTITLPLAPPDSSESAATASSLSIAD
ncbi:MAG: HAMP domain-containing protein [Acidobacteriia bacterium]|nr:HAMP domain-containing protein [Terriglobia bacterium]